MPVNVVNTFNSVFQFFPSCITEKMQVYRGSKRCFQFFPSCILIITLLFLPGRRNAFNSFPVAS
ncbi:MAG: hypothetical protein N3E41_08675 [Thermofilaceae archaeon]|nr:hypothetical protein [Thermofilaceae archaeon]